MWFFFFLNIPIEIMLSVLVCLGCVNKIITDQVTGTTEMNFLSIPEVLKVSPGPCRAGFLGSLFPGQTATLWVQISSSSKDSSQIVSEPVLISSFS